jgi:hypothetical protein
MDVHVRTCIMPQLDGYASEFAIHAGEAWLMRTYYYSEYRSNVNSPCTEGNSYFCYEAPTYERFMKFFFERMSQ